jgi:demethylmenaquinone methyltransferase/2-methoxy-6-polyprenyl-1,4-benzoquinol methylase
VKTYEIEEPEVCFRGEGSDARTDAVNRFDRQSVIWEGLMSVAGYPAAYRDLFGRLRRAGMLPEGAHRVLDAGAGTATLSRAYLQDGRGSVRVTALDSSGGMLARARRNWNAEAGRLTTIAGDVANTGFRSGHFDVVMSAHCIEHTPDPEAAIREMARVLRGRGLLLLVAGREGALDAITSRIWRYPRIDARDILRWMWEHGVAPMGRVRFGSAYQCGHWLSEAVVGRKDAAEGRS